MTNPLCRMLGIQYPILLGGMLLAGRAPLVTAVSEGGGLGILGAGRMRPKVLEAEIAEIRAHTQNPFGVNLPLRSPKAEILAQVITEMKVPVVTTSAGSPDLYTSFLKDRGVTVLQVSSTVKQALKAQKAGVDAVVAEGFEAGGFMGKDHVTTMALIPQVVDALDIPVIAAGGIADGRGLAAALCLGAAGIQVGTRFLAATECSIPAPYKKALLMASDTDTQVVGNPSGGAHRTLKKELMQAATVALQQTPMASNEAAEWAQALASLQGSHTTSGGSAGQGAGLIREIRPASEIIERIMAQASQTARGLTELLT